MTFNIATPAGVVEIIAPFKVAKKYKTQLKKLFAEITGQHDAPAPGENIEAFLKRIDPEIDSPIGTIKGLLGLYGWTQKDLAKKSGLTPSMICDILKGRRAIGVTTAKKLGKALQKDYRVFL